jgi:hypothetical protein
MLPLTCCIPASSCCLQLQAAPLLLLLLLAADMPEQDVIRRLATCRKQQNSRQVSYIQ